MKRVSIQHFFCFSIHIPEEHVHWVQVWDGGGGAVKESD